MSVYLLHFVDENGDHDTYKHAGHYLGYAGRGNNDRASVFARLKEHLAGRGSALTRAARDAGLNFQVARIWEGADKDAEWQLRQRKENTRLCPICNPNAHQRATDI